jgi:hypothetical protein
MGLSGHLHTLTTVCVNKGPLGHIQHEAGDRPEPVLLSTEQTYALSSTTTLCYSCKTSCTLHACSVQSIGNHGGGGSVVKVSYFQLTWPGGRTARNCAALVFRPEV